MKARVYAASSWRNEYQPDVVKHLRDVGYGVYDFRHPEGGDYGFSWSSIDPEWKNWTFDQLRAALKHPIAQKGFDLDMHALEWCDICVLVLPCGRSAHLELGQAVGKRKVTAVYCPPEVKMEPELMYGMVDILTSSLWELTDELWEEVGDLSLPFRLTP